MITKTSQSKYWKAKSNKQIESYWTSDKATLRSIWFAECLKKYSFDSVFEIGVFSGRNIKYIKDIFPGIKAGGLDVNSKAIQFTKEKMPDLELFCIDLYDIEKLQFMYDIVYTSGTLIHIVPDDLEGVIKKILPHASKYVMHIEEIGKNTLVAGPKHMGPSKKESDQCQWAPDLLAVYRDLGYEPEVIPLPDGCKTNGAAELVVVKL